MLCALAEHAVVAHYLLVLRHLGRHAEKLLAEVALTTMQLQILVALLPKYLSAQPTIGEAMLAVARLCGHLRSNGHPGWQVLGRGWQRLLEYERAFALGLQAKGGVVINHEGWVRYFETARYGFLSVPMAMLRPT